MFITNEELGYDERFNMLNIIDMLLIFKKIEKLGVSIPDNATFYSGYRFDYMHYDDLLDPLYWAFRYGEFGEFELLAEEDCGCASLELHDLSTLLSMHDLSADQQDRLATLESQFESLPFSNETTQTYEDGILTIYVMGHEDQWHLVVEEIVEVVLQARKLLEEVEAMQ